MSAAPEVWLRGPLADFAPQAMPAAHSLLQTAEELVRAVREPAVLAPAELWARPAGAASAGYHLAHLANSTDRLLTYAEGLALGEAQLRALRAEDALLAPLVEAGDASGRPGAEALLDAALAAVARAVDVVRETPPASYAAPRAVGRARLPTTVWGLLFHVAEHAQRHAGQLAVVARVARVARAGPA